MNHQVPFISWKETKRKYNIKAKHIRQLQINSSSDLILFLRIEYSLSRCWGHGKCKKYKNDIA